MKRFILTFDNGDPDNELQKWLDDNKNVEIIAMSSMLQGRWITIVIIYKEIS